MLAQSDPSYTPPGKRQVQERSDGLRQQLSSDEDSKGDSIDNTLMEALAECYQAASSWETRRQILSIMADKVRYSKALRYIPASVRKSLQGLDYVSSAGAQAFEDLFDVVERLGDAGKGMGWTKDLQSRLRAAKRYLKNDYKVHVSQVATVTDHCRLFALSDPKDAAFQVECVDHDHNDCCDRCDLLAATLDEIELALVAQADNLPIGDNEELTFTVKQARMNITSWKAHILRSINQDAARIDALESLDESSACSQDSSAVLAVMADVIRQLKAIMPDLKTVSYRQDNAGCYHCGATIVCASTLGVNLDVTIKRLDFSDPQGGKGASDRKAATIKSHMRIHLNAGHDIETPAQMYDAVLSSGGVPSLSVTLCESVTGPPMAKYKIDGVSLISNIEYSAEEGIRVWRAYGVEPGRLISTDPPSLDGIPSLTVVQANPSSFSTVKRRTTTSDTRGVVHEEQSDEEHASTTSGEMLFTCPEETCTKTFLRHSSMMRHLDCGKHQCTLEHETLLDKAALEYAEQLEGHSTMVPVVSMASRGPSEHPQSMGWALKSSGSRRARFTQAQKSYLTAKFRLGEQTGHKADPASVSRSMMFAKDSSGSRLFTSDDFLTANQITSFFSRLASKKSLADDQQQDDIEVAAHEAGIEEIVNEVMYELVPKHPIIFDVYNLCELASKRKLKIAKFTRRYDSRFFVCFQEVKPKDKMDRTTFREILRIKFSMTDDMLMDRVFRAFDKDTDSFIRMEDWILGLSVFLRGSLDKRTEFCFNVYDLNGDSYISKEEITQLLKNTIIKQPTEEDPDEGIRDLCEITMKLMKIRLALFKE
ncbi:hypothetical protein QZH41_000987 [Actinostola sp. cb2023]|nr:hypothetical protein QZH41_000987 [Actinostola sp. cb2023]